VEVVGTYNPRTNPGTIDIKREPRGLLGIEGRAQMSERVGKIVKHAPVAAPVAAIA